MPRFSTWSLPFRFPHKTPVCISLLPHTCFMPTHFPHICLIYIHVYMAAYRYISTHSLQYYLSSIFLLHGKFIDRVRHVRILKDQRVQLRNENLCQCKPSLYHFAAIKSTPNYVKAQNYSADSAYYIFTFV
jgi:hypothetical protein